MYQYEARVTKVYDADTITVDIDLGFGVMLKKQSIRLYGINAPEVRGPERPQGLRSRDWLRDQVLDKKIVINTFKDKKGKFGRWIAEIVQVEGEINRINEQLVSLGLAKDKEY